MRAVSDKDEAQPDVSGPSTAETVAKINAELARLAARAAKSAAELVQTRRRSTRWAVVLWCDTAAMLAGVGTVLVMASHGRPHPWWLGFVVLWAGLSILLPHGRTRRGRPWMPREAVAHTALLASWVLWATVSELTDLTVPMVTRVGLAVMTTAFGAAGLVMILRVERALGRYSREVGQLEQVGDQAMAERQRLNRLAKADGEAAHHTDRAGRRGDRRRFLC